MLDAKILTVVGAHFGVPIDVLTSPRADRATAWPRQVAIWVATRTTRLNLRQIGQAFGGRHHSTALHARRAVDSRREADPAFADQLESLIASVETKAPAPKAASYACELAARLLQKPAGARAASGQELGIICGELLRLAAQVEFQSPPQEEKIHVADSN